MSSFEAVILVCKIEFCRGDGGSSIYLVVALFILSCFARGDQEDAKVNGPPG